MISNRDLEKQLETILESHSFKDYGPNGLQVEGRREIKHIVCGVTACQALIDAAIAKKADALLVHHGLFWKGEPQVVTGFRRQRLKALLSHDINLFAYHLPLDAHPTLGNNACLAARFGFQIDGYIPNSTGATMFPYTTLATPLTVAELGVRLEQALTRTPQIIGRSDKQLTNIAWVSGAAQSYIELAATHGMDAYISGEISEPTVHIAREMDVAYFAVGHHASERYGVQALANRLQGNCPGCTFEFIDIDNPV